MNDGASNEEILAMVCELRDLKEAHAEQVAQERMLHREWVESGNRTSALAKQVKELTDRIHLAL